MGLQVLPSFFWFPLLFPFFFFGLAFVSDYTVAQGYVRR